MDRDEDDLDDRYYGKNIGKGRFQGKNNLNIFFVKPIYNIVSNSYHN